MINENALTAFLTLARTGSFKEAAREIGVSNASLSRYIAQAEAEAGFTLFNRTRNNSKLTREGYEFLPVAQTLQTDLESYARRVADMQHAGGGILRIGCGPLTTRTLIMPVLLNLHKEMPELRFEVVVSAYQRPLDLLQSGQFDVFIGDLTYTPAADDIEIVVMDKQPIIFLAHTAHEIHAKGPQSLAELFEYPFASPHLHKHWKATLIEALGGSQQAEEKVKALPQIECDDYGFLSGLLAKPDFIVGGMRETFAETLGSKTVREIVVSPPIHWNICASRKAQDASAALDLFWSMLIKTNATG
jgi:DNA-binding transcriptional LysR family regulator